MNKSGFNPGIEVELVMIGSTKILYLRLTLKENH